MTCIPRCLPPEVAVSRRGKAQNNTRPTGFYSASGVDTVYFRGASTLSGPEISMGLLRASESQYLVVRTFAVHMAHMVLRAFWDQPRLDIRQVARAFRGMVVTDHLTYTPDVVKAYADAVREVREKAPTLIHVHAAILKEMEAATPDRALRASLTNTARQVLINVSENERDLKLRWYARELIVDRLKARR